MHEIRICGARTQEGYVVSKLCHTSTNFPWVSRMTCPAVRCTQQSLVIVSGTERKWTLDTKRTTTNNKGEQDMGIGADLCASFAFLPPVSQFLVPFFSLDLIWMANRKGDECVCLHKRQWGKTKVRVLTASICWSLLIHLLSHSFSWCRNRLLCDASFLQQKCSRNKSGIRRNVLSLPSDYWSVQVKNESERRRRAHLLWTKSLLGQYYSVLLHSLFPHSLNLLFALSICTHWVCSLFVGEQKVCCMDHMQSGRVFFLQEERVKKKAIVEWKKGTKAWSDISHTEKKPWKNAKKERRRRREG